MIFTDLGLAIEEGTFVSEVENRDYVLTHHHNHYHVLPHGSGYNGHKVLEIFRCPTYYLMRQSRR